MVAYFSEQSKRSRSRRAVSPKQRIEGRAEKASKRRPKAPPRRSARSARRSRRRRVTDQIFTEESSAEERRCKEQDGHEQNCKEQNGKERNNHKQNEGEESRGGCARPYETGLCKTEQQQAQIIKLCACQVRSCLPSQPRLQTGRRSSGFRPLCDDRRRGAGAPGRSGPPNTAARRSPRRHRRDSSFARIRRCRKALRLRHRRAPRRAGFSLRSTGLSAILRSSLLRIASSALSRP